MLFSLPDAPLFFREWPTDQVAFDEEPEPAVMIPLILVNTHRIPLIWAIFWYWAPPLFGNLLVGVATSGEIGGLETYSAAAWTVSFKWSHSSIIG